MSETRRFATCPQCQRRVSALLKADGWHLWRHKKALMGTAESGWGVGRQCPGSGQLVPAPQA